MPFCNDAVLMLEDEMKADLVGVELEHEGSRSISGIIKVSWRGIYDSLVGERS
jgi:hypothetical protein